MIDKRRVGDFITYTRIKKAIGLAHFARMIGLSVSDVIAIESGKLEPSEYTLKKMVAVLGEDYNTIVAGVPQDVYDMMEKKELASARGQETSETNTKIIINTALNLNTTSSDTATDSAISTSFLDSLSNDILSESNFLENTTVTTSSAPAKSSAALDFDTMFSDIAKDNNIVNKTETTDPNLLDFDEMFNNIAKELEDNKLPSSNTNPAPLLNPKTHPTPQQPNTYNSNTSFSLEDFDSNKPISNDVFDGTTSNTNDFSLDDFDTYKPLPINMPGTSTQSKLEPSNSATQTDHIQINTSHHNPADSFDITQAKIITAGGQITNFDGSVVAPSEVEKIRRNSKNKPPKSYKSAKQPKSKNSFHPSTLFMPLLNLILGGALLVLLLYIPTITRNGIELLLNDLAGIELALDYPFLVNVAVTGTIVFLVFNAIYLLIKYFVQKSSRGFALLLIFLNTLLASAICAGLAMAVFYMPESIQFIEYFDFITLGLVGLIPLVNIIHLIVASRKH